MVDYGWDIPQVLDHTQYQLDHLYRALLVRRGRHNQILANVVRAHQAKESDFKEFLASLVPDFSAPGSQQFVQTFEKFES